MRILSSKVFKLGLEVLREVHALKQEASGNLMKTNNECREETQKKLDRAVEFLLNETITEEHTRFKKKELEKFVGYTKNKAG